MTRLRLLCDARPVLLTVERVALLRRVELFSQTPDRVLAFVGRVYEQAFGILQIMGDAEAEGE